MKMIKFVFIYSSFVLTCSHAQQLHPSWAVSPICLQNDLDVFIETDQSDVLVTGSFSGTIAFDDISLQSNGGYDVFVAKYSSLGDVIWAVSFGANGQEFSWNIDVDGDGNIYVVGRFSSNSVSFGSSTIINQGNSDIFIVKFDLDGNEIWAKSAGSLGNEYEASIAVDSQGNCVLVGRCTAHVIYFDSYSISSLSGTNAFITKYDSEGNVLWVMQGESSNNSEFDNVAFDPDDNILVVGVLNGEITLSGILFNFPNPCLFLGKLDTDGNVIWGRSIGLDDPNNPPNIACDSHGNVFISAPFSSDTLYFGDEKLVSGLNATSFTAKYNSSGDLSWAKLNHGRLIHGYMSMTIDNEDKVYLTGSYDDSLINFGPSELVNPNDSLQGFLIIRDKDGNKIEGFAIGGGGHDLLSDVASDANGNIYLAMTSLSNHFHFGGNALTNHGGYDTYVFRYSRFYFHENNSLLIPNPFSETAILYMDNYFENGELLIYNLSGELVTQESNLKGDYVVLRGEDVAAGVYYFRLFNETGLNVSGKFVIIH